MNWSSWEELLEVAAALQTGELHVRGWLYDKLKKDAFWFTLTSQDWLMNAV